MRDIVLVLVASYLLIRTFKRPEIGAYLWAWFSLMNPHKMAYGFAYSLPFAQLIALVSMGALLMNKQRRVLPWNGLTALWALLVLWMTVTSFFALNSTDLVLERWIFVFKIQLMTLVTFMLIANAQQLKILVSVVTLSIAFFGIKGGVFTILTGGSFRVWGPPAGLLNGNNELAIGLAMVVPFMYWMREVTPARWMRHVLMAGILLCLAAILGTQSRGAYLAVFVMALFLGLKSNHPVRMTGLLVLLLVAVVALMPESWTARMDTIGTYEQDNSAMSRIWTWNTMWNVAVDRPLVGAGFRADARNVFAAYAPKGGEWAVFEGLIYVAHSIYFQMLGEHGFVGLLLYLGLWTLTWIKAGQHGQRARQLPELAGWLPLLMRMTQVSLMAYAIGGAFLSLAYLDLPYFFLGFVVVAGQLIEQAARQQPAAPVDPQVGGRAVAPGAP